jgi:predicted alpha/beta superfamily hydrolase
MFMPLRLLSTALLLALGLPEPVLADAVTVPGLHRIDIMSKAVGRPYRLLVHVPSAPPPPGGYPLVVVLDGNLYFATTVDALRLQGRHFLRPAVVLGVGYQTDDIIAQLTLREKDLTLPIDAKQLEKPIYRLVTGPRVPPVSAYGDLDAVLRMIEAEAIPAVRALVPLDLADRHIVGHSLGGLGALRALFNGPACWRTATASSPSIWWADRAVLKDRPMQDGRCKGPHSLLLIVGGHEEEKPPGVPALPPGLDPAELSMAGNVKALSAELAAGSRIAVREVVQADDDHVSIVPLSISRALRFALGRHPEDWLRAPDR